ncbi:2Fe-2S iron-sulfur cluster-binding protein [Natrialbaceae archaeon A-gly3]
MVKSYTVELVDEETTIGVSENQSILEAAEEAGIELPYQCRMGICGVCSAMRENDCDVEQMEGMFLSESEKEEGYILTCIAKPRSDVRIRTNESP